MTVVAQTPSQGVGVAAAPAAYWPALDSLRAVAVLAVAASHFGSSVPFFYEYGPSGVRLFFVLSGFLITGILLSARAAAESAGASRRQIVGRFYARRALRLLPLFYGVLVVTYALDFESIRHTITWHTLYASNIRFAMTNSWEESYSHFWSLAVEEQFYFVWPGLILWTPYRWLSSMIVGVVIAGFLFQTFGRLFGLSQIAVWVLPFGSLDALGLGALLAVAMRQGQVDQAGRDPRGWVDRAFRPAAIAVVLRMTAWVFGWINVDTEPAWVASISNLALALLFVWLVARGAAPRRRLIDRCLVWPAGGYVGRISYGIYVIHMFTPSLLAAAFHAVSRPMPNNLAVNMLMMTAVSIGIAAISWRWYESPLNGLRQRIPYLGDVPPRHARASANTP